MEHGVSVHLSLSQRMILLPLHAAAARAECRHDSEQRLLCLVFCKVVLRSA